MLKYFTAQLKETTYLFFFICQDYYVLSIKLFVGKSIKQLLLFFQNCVFNFFLVGRLDTFLTPIISTFHGEKKIFLQIRILYSIVSTVVYNFQICCRQLLLHLLPILNESLADLSDARCGQSPSSPINLSFLNVFSTWLFLNVVQVVDYLDTERKIKS